MEKRSVYEYIKENINVNGKFSADASLREYVENQKKDSDLDLYNEDNLYIGKEKISFDFLFGEVDKIEFRLFSLFDKAIKESNFKELDKYLSESTFSVRKNLEELKARIVKNIENIDESELLKVCKEEIRKTKSIYMIYIYLIVLSKLDIKKDDEVQEIILRFALVHEYTKFINEQLIDKCSYPDYKRFYLAKRLNNKADINGIIAKMKIDTPELREWALFTVSNNYDSNDIVEILNILDLEKFLKEKGEIRQYYNAVGRIIFCFILGCKKEEEYPFFTKVLKEYIKKFSSHVTDYEMFDIAAHNYIVLLDDYSFMEEVILVKEEKEKILKEYKKALTTEPTINMLKDILNSGDRKMTKKVFDIIARLNIKELILMLFNYYKSDPVGNDRMLFALQNVPEVYEKAVYLLYESIDLDELIGDYENVIRDEDVWSPVDTLIESVRKMKELAVKVYAKTLRAKSLNYRKSTVRSIFSWTFDDEFSIDNLPDELKESIEYIDKNELNDEIRKQLNSILGKDKVDIFEQYENIKEKLRLVGKNDEKVIEANKNIFDKNDRKMHLNTSDIFGKLSIDESIDAYKVLDSNKLLYFDKMDDEYYAFIQGSRFGEEYIVKLKYDKDYKLIDTICNCGNNKNDRFCKHVSALLMQLGRINKLREESNNKK